jgi:hypothetical protein
MLPTLSGGTHHLDQLLEQDTKPKGPKRSIVNKGFAIPLAAASIWIG